MKKTKTFIYLALANFLLVGCAGSEKEELVQYLAAWDKYYVSWQFLIKSTGELINSDFYAYKNQLPLEKNVSF